MSATDKNQADFWGDSEPRSQVMAVHEMPAARLAASGSAALSDSELVAMVLGGDQHKALAVARRLVAEAGNIQAFAGWGVIPFEAAGASQAGAWRLMAAVELGRRALMQSTAEAPVLNRAELVREFMQAHVAGLQVEKFWVLCLDRKTRLKRAVCISTGTATCTVAHPREVFRAAVSESAAAIMCVHNHPSGDPSPSAPDLHVTRQLREAARALDIDLLDHVICGEQAKDPQGRGYFSFREAGLL